MKIKSLIPTAAMLVFAAAAAAQSDPSVGGSFGGMPRTAGTVNIATQNRVINTSTRAHVQAQPSFWNRLTGRNTTMVHGRADRPVQHRSWFGLHQASSRPVQRQHHSWFGIHHNPPMSQQTRTTRVSTTASTRSSGWHLPLFNRR